MSPALPRGGSWLTHHWLFRHPKEAVSAGDLWSLDPQMSRSHDENSVQTSLRCRAGKLPRVIPGCLGQGYTWTYCGDKDQSGKDLGLAIPERLSLHAWESQALLKTRRMEKQGPRCLWKQPGAVFSQATSLASTQTFPLQLKPSSIWDIPHSP